jgi:hypothetical protein
MRSSHVRFRLRWVLLCLLTCLAISEFSIRGPVRALQAASRNFNDFISPYAQTRAWLSGRDPYSPTVLAELWPAARPEFVVRESVNGVLPARRGLPSPYLTVAFPLLLPVAKIPWKFAIEIWVAMCVLAVFAIAILLIHFAAVRERSELAIMIFASVLLLAPVHTAIASSNIVTIALALGLGSALCLARNRDVAAGVLLVLATGLKPTIALPFVIYSIVSRNRLRVIAPAMLTAVLLLCIALIPQHARTLWWDSFSANNRSMFAPGAIDDFTTANPLRFQLIHLQVALFPILQHRVSVQATAALIFVIVLSAWLWAVSRDGELGLLDLALLTAAALLPVYHRFTDAGLLLVPVTWSLAELRGNLRKYAIACLLLISPFLVPGATMLYELSQKNEVFQKLSHTRLWDLFILPHECWLILTLCVVLLAARLKLRGSRRLLEPGLATAEVEA